MPGQTSIPVVCIMLSPARKFILAHKQPFYTWVAGMYLGGGGGVAGPKILTIQLHSCS